LWFSFRIQFYTLVFQPRYNPNVKFHEQRGLQEQQHGQQLEPQQQQEQQHSDLSKEVITIIAQLLVLVIRLDYVEKKLMMRK
jgi:hypothetical protein